MVKIKTKFFAALLLMFFGQQCFGGGLSRALSFFTRPYFPIFLRNEALVRLYGPVKPFFSKKTYNSDLVTPEQKKRLDALLDKGKELDQYPNVNFAQLRELSNKFDRAYDEFVHANKFQPSLGLKSETLAKKKSSWMKRFAGVFVIGYLLAKYYGCDDDEVGDDEADDKDAPSEKN